MRIAINGFGRIGRMVFRAYLTNVKQDGVSPLEIVAINDLGSPKQSAHLLKYDSNYGPLPIDAVGEEGKLIVTDSSNHKREYELVQSREPEKLPWKDLDIDLVLECSGAFTSREGASKHLTAGAKRVMISAPAKDAIDRTMVMGVNNQDFDPKTDFIVSNGSCTTNGLAPLCKVLEDNFGIKCGLMTTIHAYTNDQNLHDNEHKDFRRARAAALNMLPTSTGAAKAISLVIPSLEGKLSGIAIRIPTPVVSLIDLTVELNTEVNKESVNAAMKAASEGALKGILGYSDLPLVSSDFKGDNRSSIFDSLETQVGSGRLVKILSWYDNEWAYACRCLDLASHMASKLGGE